MTDTRSAALYRVQDERTFHLRREETHDLKYSYHPRRKMLSQCNFITEIFPATSFILAKDITWIRFIGSCSFNQNSLYTFCVLCSSFFQMMNICLVYCLHVSKQVSVLKYGKYLKQDKHKLFTKENNPNTDNFPFILLFLYTFFLRIIRLSFFHESCEKISMGF